MKIKFIGAVGGDVTGSCILCCARNGTRFLVDCGTFQGGIATETKNTRFPFNPKSIDFVLLTHAHADHCGRIPALYDRGFRGKIICSEATRDLTILNIPELKKITEWKKQFITEEQRSEIGEMGKSFFIDNDIQITMLRSSHFLGCTSFVVGWNIYKESKGDQSKHQNRSICFSGDLGNVVDSEDNHLPLLKEGFAPSVHTDYIVMESTYGAQVRESEYKDFTNRIESLDKLTSADDVDTLVFACFSMQRTQDVLFDLLYLAMHKNRCFAITLDSSMGAKACNIYRKILGKLKKGKKDEEKFVYLNKKFMERFLPLLGDDYMKNMPEGCNRDIQATRKFLSDVLETKFNNDNVTISFKNHDESHETQTEEDQSEKKESKKIYISSSGMFQYGNILKHLQKRYGDERTAFFITGFCKSTANGKAIVAWSENANSKEHFITCEDGEKISRAEWRAKIYNIAPYYSGHADAESLLRFLLYSTEHGDGEGKWSVPDKKQVTVFLNHGDASARAGLKKKIEEESKKPEKQDVRKIKRVVLPNATDPFFDLDTGEWDTNPSDLLSPVFTAPVKASSYIKKTKKEKGKKRELNG